MARPAYNFSEAIATEVRNVARRGGTKTQALLIIQELGYQEAPSSYKTFIKYYGETFETEAAKLDIDMIDEALRVTKVHLKNDNFDAAKFVLERKGGWHKKDQHHIVEETVDDTEEKAAKAKLADLLGRKDLSDRFQDEEE